MGRERKVVSRLLSVLDFSPLFFSSREVVKGGIMGGFRPAGSTANTRPIPPPAPSIAKPVPLSKQQQQQSTSTPSTSTIARRVEGVPGSVRGDSIKLGRSTGGEFPTLLLSLSS